MDNKKEVLNRLEHAIDMADMPQIEFELERLTSLEENPISPEEPALFSARVRALQKENEPMKKSKRLITIGVVAAVLVVMSITVYASGILNRFTFGGDNSLTTVHTTESITDEKAKALVDNVDAPVDPSKVATADTENLSFSTLEEAEKGMDMRLLLPADISGFNLDSANGSIVSFGETVETRTTWLNYSDASGRQLGITVVKEIIADGESVTGIVSHDMDPDSLGSYTTPAGTKYTTLTDSNPNDATKVAHIATTTVGNYEYTVVTMGFDQAQREAMVNSVDLSMYQ